MAKSPLAVKRKSTLSAYEPSLREKAAILGEKGFKAVTGREPGYEARENINRYTGLLDLLEVPGAVLSANDAARNLKSKQYGSAAGDIAGLAAGAIPIVGGALKGRAKKAVKEGVEGASKLAVKAKKKFQMPAQGREYTPEEQAVYDAFGSKFKAETKRAKQVQAAASAENVAPAKTGKKKAASAAVAQKYRILQEQEGPDAVLAAARKGEHLRPSSTGYTGAPRTVTSPQGLGAMRGSLDAQFGDAAGAIDMAIPGQVGTWYDRAKSGMAESVEPYQLDRALEQHGVYSAGVAPESEMGFVLKHHNSRMLGEPKVAFRNPGAETLDSAVAEYRKAKMGPKTGQYKSYQDPRVPTSGLFGVNDFRAAQTFGYTTPEGKPWRAAVSETMHPFMDAETALAVDRANATGAFGRSDWTGPHLQEVPWIYGKAQDLYSRGASGSGRFGGEPIEGITKALSEANMTPADYHDKHAISATYEYAPGANTGHYSDYTKLSPEAQEAYGQRGAWAQPAPELTIDLPRREGSMPRSVGAGDRDVLYSALGLRQLPTIDSQGAYRNSAGEMEFNKLHIARPLGDFPTGGGGGRFDPLTMNSIEAVEGFRALNDAQEAGAANAINTGASVKGKNALMFERLGRQPTAEELEKTIKILGPELGERYGISATNRGVSMFPFDPDSASPKDINDFIKRNQAALSEAMPDAVLQKGVASTAYVPGLGKFNENYEIVPTTPYSGEATQATLERFAALPQEVSTKLGESDAVRAALREKYARDEGLPGVRGDLQNTRKFFSEADWPKAVALMRRGLSATAALTALGYASSSLAETPE